MFFTKNEGINFYIKEFQTNNILNVGIEIFMNKEKVEIIETKFKAKSQTMLETSLSKNFNSCHMIIEDKIIIIIQKSQVNKLLIIDIDDYVKK